MQRYPKWVITVLQKTTRSRGEPVFWETRDKSQQNLRLVCLINRRQFSMVYTLIDHKMTVEYLAVSVISMHFEEFACKQITNQ